MSEITLDTVGELATRAETRGYWSNVGRRLLQVGVGDDALGGGKTADFIGGVEFDLDKVEIGRAHV